MKKIFSVLLLLLMAAPAFCDEIIDSKGMIIPCKIETVSAGLVQYKKDGNLYSFKRIEDNTVFNDYVDIRVDLRHKESVERRSGQVISRDFDGIILKEDTNEIHIPWYRVKFIGIYKP